MHYGASWSESETGATDKTLTDTESWLSHMVIRANQGDARERHTERCDSCTTFRSERRRQGNALRFAMPSTSTAVRFWDHHTMKLLGAREKCRNVPDSPPCQDSQAFTT